MSTAPLTEPPTREAALLASKNKTRPHPSPHNLIRAVLNRELGFAKSSGALTSSLEAERERSINFIFQLYQIAIARSAGALLRDPDIIKVAACLRRLQLVGHRDLDELFEHCRERSKNDPVYFHERDSLQLRHLLTFADTLPDEELGMIDLAELETNVLQNRPLDVKKWFKRISERAPRLSTDAPAFIRGYVEPLLSRTCAASYALHFELAVLDVRLLGPIGWENTRSFYSLLKVLRGRECVRFNDYMDRHEIRDALAFFQQIGDSESAEHFELLDHQFSPTALDSLRNCVSEASVAVIPKTVTPSPRRYPLTPAPIPERSWIRRLFNSACHEETNTDRAIASASQH